MIATQTTYELIAMALRHGTKLQCAEVEQKVTRAAEQLNAHQVECDTAIAYLIRRFGD